MRFDRRYACHAAFYLAVTSAITVLISITASHVLLGLSLAALVASRTRLRLPRIWLPLALFLAGSLLSMALSPEPAHGLPQVKKMFVFATLLVVYSTFSKLSHARGLYLVWAGIGAVVGGFGLARFTLSLHEAQSAQRPLYDFYLENRFTGFMSHPMTYGHQHMIVVLLLVAFLLFASGLRKRFLGVGLACVALLGGALLINGTRTVWLGTAAGGIWLLWSWKRWLAAAAPAGIVLFIWLVPGPVHDRFVSVFQPRKNVDSNEFRLICVRTGVRMIADRPLFGIGLEETKYRFMEYLPEENRESRPPGFYQHLHNVYLQYAAERGIPTLVMMLWLLLQIIYDFHSALRHVPAGRSDERFLLHAGIATVIGIMVSGLFEVNLGDSEVLAVFLAVVACGYVAAGHTTLKPARAKAMNG